VKTRGFLGLLGCGSMMTYPNGYIGSPHSHQSLNSEDTSKPNRKTERNSRSHVSQFTMIQIQAIEGEVR